MIAYYEGETDHPPTTLLPALARALNLTFDEMLGSEPAPSHKRAADTRLWRRFKQIEQMPSRERRQVIKLLDIFLEHERLKKVATGNAGHG